MLRAVGITAVFLMVAPSGLAQCSGHAQLNKYERAQFVQVTNGVRGKVFAEFLATPGCGGRMLAALSQLTSKIIYADKTVGYALISISREKVLDALDLPGIAYAYTNDDDRLYSEQPPANIAQNRQELEPMPQIIIPYPRVTLALPPGGPYFATDEIGLAELWEQYPDADGRGVRVAVVDEGFDLLHPALRRARDAQGNFVPKIADLGTLTSAEQGNGWVRFGPPIRTRNGNFEAAGVNWIAPEEGTYRFGIFRQDLVLGPIGNSRSKKLTLAVGILWDQRSKRVWVDTDGDCNFQNQRALADYGVAQDVDWFGAKDGGNDNRIPFGVKMDAVRDSVYLRIGGEHGAFVAGGLAGNKLTGGLFDGSAPSAQLVDENLGRATLIASIVKMFARFDVDVINFSGGLGRSGYTDNREGIEDFAQRVIERVITVYNKPIATYSAALGTIHVMDYAGPEMLRRNRQVGPPYKDTINSFVWWLPNGAVNTVVAPSANLETDSRYKPQDIPWDDGRRHSFSDDSFSPPAPDGYVIGANPSPTIPVVSGLLADLISEARRDHVRYNAMRLDNAVFTGTRLLDDIPLSQQGYGLINAAQSWTQLSKMSNADDPQNPELTSISLSQIKGGKKTEVQGFQVDLPKAGETLSGEIWLTRRGGYAGPRGYTFALRGNDGSITLLDSEATLVRDEPARVRFKSNGAPGWHIVFLELRDAKADVVMQDVPVSVRVPEVPEKAAPGVDTYEATIQPLTSQDRYVWVGDEVQAARFVMRIPYTGPENISTRDFPGGRYRTTKAPPGDPVDASHHVGPMETLESLVVNDEPGSQEIFWENRGRPEYATAYDGPSPDVAIHAKLTVSKFAVGIAKKTSETLAVTNKLAETTGRVELYDAALRREPLTGAGLHGTGELDRAVPPGLAQWRLRVRFSPFSRGPADVFVMNCTGTNHCLVVAQQEISVLSKPLVIDKPPPGSWRIVVRSRGEVSGPQNYKIDEALLVSASTQVESSDVKRRSGAKWTLSLPKKLSDAQYAAFRIAGTPDVESEKNGLLIAMTALGGGAP
jgi:Subtilase family